MKYALLSLLALSCAVQADVLPNELPNQLMGMVKTQQVSEASSYVCSMNKLTATGNINAPYTMGPKENTTLQIKARGLVHSSLGTFTYVYVDVVNNGQIVQRAQSDFGDFFAMRQGSVFSFNPYRQFTFVTIDNPASSEGFVRNTNGQPIYYIACQESKRQVPVYVNAGVE